MKHHSPRVGALLDLLPSAMAAALVGGVGKLPERGGGTTMALATEDALQALTRRLRAEAKTWTRSSR